MNTRKKLRRYEYHFDKDKRPPQGTYIHSLTNPPYAEHLAGIVAEFVTLEIAMADVLGVLLGLAFDDEAPDYVLHAIKSVKGRIDVMRTLLERAPHNAKLGAEYDEMIDEFAAINGQRNKYVHGQWYTNLNTKAVYLAELDEVGFAFGAAKPVTLEELDAFRGRIDIFMDRIHTTAGAELARRTRQKPHPRQPA